MTLRKPTNTFRNGSLIFYARVLTSRFDESSVRIVADWAMKFEQTNFREKQSDWYGKRGLSWHVSSVISKDSSTDTVVVTTYAHLFDSCTQDWFAVAPIIENLPSTIKSDFPLVNKANLRSDEAGCYHNNLFIASLADIGKRVGISVQSYNFSEPQQRHLRKNYQPLKIVYPKIL